MALGIIDIYPKDDQLMAALENRDIEGINKPKSSVTSTHTFLTVITPEIQRIPVSGVFGINQIYPESWPTLQIVRQALPLYTEKEFNEQNRKASEDIEKLSKKDQEKAKKDQEVKNEQYKRTWRLFYNKRVLPRTGVNHARLAEFARLAGLEVMFDTEDYLQVMMPEKYEDKSSDDKEPVVMRYLKQKLKDEEDARKKREVDQRKEQKNALYHEPPSEIQKAGTYNYAFAQGTNLQELLSLPDIDKTLTTSNDTVEIYRAFGIEAARNSLYQEIGNAIPGDIYISPRHLYVLVNFMTRSGEPLAFTYSGMSKQKLDPMSTISFERAFEVATEAALRGRTDDIRGISGKVAVGEAGSMGTGMAQASLNLEAVEERIRNKQVSAGDISSALKNMRVGKIAPKQAPGTSVIPLKMPTSTYIPKSDVKVTSSSKIGGITVATELLKPQQIDAVASEMEAIPMAKPAPEVKQSVCGLKSGQNIEIEAKPTGTGFELPKGRPVAGPAGLDPSLAKTTKRGLQLPESIRAPIEELPTNEPDVSAARARLIG